MRRYPVALVGVLIALLSPTLTQGAIKVACVGDSITQNSGWCEALGTKLGSEYQASNFGVSGTTLLKAGDSPYWTSAKFTPSHDFAPNIVVIMLGTNDSKPRNWSQKAAFVTDYAALIDSYASLATHPSIYINLPPPAGTNTYSISGTVIANEIIPLIRQVATNKQLPIIDIFTAFGGNKFDASLYGAQDQVHPNSKGAQVICDVVYNALIASRPSGAGGAGSGGVSSSSGGAAATSGSAGIGGASGSRSSISSNPSPTGGNSASGGRSSAGGQSASGGAATPTGGAINSASATAVPVGGSITGGTSNGLGGAGGQVTSGTSSSASRGGTAASNSSSTANTGNQPGSSTANTGNQPGSTTQFGSGGQSSHATNAQTTDTGTSNGSSDASGCGCRVAQPSSAGAPLLFMALTAFLQRIRRSRERRQCGSRQ
jgi:MYXO-CTERM domain-containing protein